MSIITMQGQWRILVLFLACMCYMFVGAIIFSSIEGTEEETMRGSLNSDIRMFLDENPSVDFQDLVYLLKSVKQAADQGIYPDEVLAASNISAEWNRIKKPGRKNWDAANAFYFSATVVTTIGYGHLSPSTRLGKNVCILYAFVGIPFIGWLIAEVTKLCRDKGHAIGEKIYNNVFCCIKVTKLRRSLTALVMFAFIYGFLVFLPALVFAYLEDWDIPTAHYYCFISLSTIGFGDFVATDSLPNDSKWRWVYKVGTVLYFLFGLASLAIVLNSVQQRQQRNAKRFKEVLMRGKKLPEGVDGEEAASNGFMGEDGATSEDDDEGGFLDVKRNGTNSVNLGRNLVKESAV